MSPRPWSSAPGTRFATHRHAYSKVLICVSGSIVFHSGEEDLDLGPGDRLDVEAGTDHAATVGSEGVRCVEAARPEFAFRSAGP